MKSCGSCTLCCKIPAIAELAKPAGQWCQHVRQGKGCGIHGSHPFECQAFRCGWLQMEYLGDEWKPSNAKFILRVEDAAGKMVVALDEGHPNAWRAEPYYTMIKHWSAQGAVLVSLGNRTMVVFPEEEVDIGETDQGDLIRIGYRDNGPMRRPWVGVEPVGGQPREHLGTPKMWRQPPLNAR